MGAYEILQGEGPLRKICPLRLLRHALTYSGRLANFDLGNFEAQNI
jgi:hypothetical protein